MDPSPTGLRSAPAPAEADASPSVLRAWAPVAVWIAVIMLMATDWFSSGRTAELFYRFVTWLFPDVGWEVVGPLHLFLRKLGHFVGYAALGALAFRAWRSTHAPTQSWNVAWAVMAVATATLVACGDETVQAFMAARGGSLLDVLLDASGACFAQFLIWRTSRRSAAAKP